MFLMQGVRKQATLLSQDSFRDFEKIPNEWTVSVRNKENFASHTSCMVSEILPQSQRSSRGIFGTIYLVEDAD